MTAAKTQEALALQPTDPAAAGRAWAAVDRLLVDLSPAAALAYIQSVDLVSERTGNYQHHPQLGVLYDQLWVQ